MTPRERVELPGLTKEAFQHPLDREAITNLKKLPYLEDILRYFVSNTGEVQDELLGMSTMIRVDETQCSDLYEKYVRIAQALNVQALPALYISNSPERNASAGGVDKYTIILNSGLIDSLEEGELFAILAHELGHVKCDHMLYTMLSYRLLRLGHDEGGIEFLGQAANHVTSGRLGDIVDRVSPILVSGMGMLAGGMRALRETALPIFWEWKRKAELSCDRAALLATQDPEATARALIKMAGFSTKYAIDLEAVVRQLERCEERAGESLLGWLFKAHNEARQSWYVDEFRGVTHPATLYRVKEVLNWSRSDQYKQILRGVYRKSAGGDGPAEPKSRRCPKCFWLSDIDEPFCGSCRTSLRNAVVVCGSCNGDVDEDWAACMHCGSWLDGRDRAPTS